MCCTQQHLRRAVPERDNLRTPNVATRVQMWRDTVRAHASEEPRSQTQLTASSKLHHVFAVVVCLAPGCLPPWPHLVCVCLDGDGKVAPQSQVGHLEKWVRTAIIHLQATRVKLCLPSALHSPCMVRSPSMCTQPPAQGEANACLQRQHP